MAGRVGRRRVASEAGADSVDEPRLLVVGTQQLGLGCETGWGKPGGVSQTGCLQVWRPLCSLGGVARQNPSHALFDNSRHHGEVSIRAI